MVREEVIHEMSREAEKPKQTYFSSKLKAIPQKSLLIIGAVILFVIYQMYTSGQDYKNMLILAVATIFFLMFISSGESESQIMDEQEQKVLLLHKLRWKQKNTGEIEDGEIRLGLDTKLNYKGKIPKKRYITWTLTPLSGGGDRTYMTAMDPFPPGMILDTIYLPEGEQALRDYKDSEILPSYDAFMQKKSMDYGGKKK